MIQPDINERNVNLWSKIGPRATYGQAILSLAGKDPNVIAVSADLGNSSGLERMAKAFPERFIDTGIAEQNLIGFASGLAKEGFTVFASSFAPFITMRACEQIRMNLGYMEHNVKAVGIGSGLSMGFLGNSHFGLEDVSVISSIPNIQIVSPADGAEIFNAVYAVAQTNNPTYLRLTGAPGIKPVYGSSYEFELGKAITLKESGNFGILGTGAVVSTALDASMVLEKDGINCSVTNFHTLRPLDVEKLLQIASSSDAIFVIEEHFDFGGLYSTVANVLMKHHILMPIYSIGIEHRFDLSGDYDFLKDYHGLTSEGISKTIKRAVSTIDSWKR